MIMFIITVLCTYVSLRPHVLPAHRGPAKTYISLLLFFEPLNMPPYFFWEALHGLPSSVSILILTEWLSIKQIGMLDSACCNKADRESFFSLCQQKEVSLSTKHVWHANQLFKWFIIRKFQLRDCTYSHKTDLSLFVEVLCKTGKSLRRLDVRGESFNKMICEAEITAIVSQVAIKCKNLIAMEFLHCCVVPCISDLFDANPGLIDLFLCGCRVVGSFPTDHCCSSPLLRNLTINKCELTPSAATFLANITPQAKKFCISGYSTSPTHECLHNMTNQLAGLCELYLVDLNLQDDDLIGIVTRCPHITLLSIPDCKSLTDKSLIVAAQHLPLKMLDIGNTNFTDESLQVISSHRAALDTFLFEGVETFSVNTICNIVNKFTKLRSVGMGCDDISAAPFVTIVAPTLNNITTLILVGGLCCNDMLFAVAKNCHRLERLDISDSGAIFCPHIDMEGVGSVLNLCVHLRLLVLAENDLTKYISGSARTLLKHLRPNVQLSTDWNLCQLHMV